METRQEQQVRFLFFGFIHVKAELMELRSVEKKKMMKKNRLMWNQKTKFQFTDKRTKTCLQPCFQKS